MKKGVPEDRVKLLERALAEAWNTAEFQEFNKKQFMHLINSYRDIAGAKRLIAEEVKTYREVYKELGLVE